MMEAQTLQFFQWFWNLFGLWDVMWGFMGPAWPTIWTVVKIFAIIVPLMLGVV